MEDSNGPPHLIWVIDSDSQPPENLSLWRMLVHGQLKHVLWAILSIESRWIIVQVYHTNHNRGNPVVQESAFWAYFWGLDTESKDHAAQHTYVIW